RTKDGRAVANQLVQGLEGLVPVTQSTAVLAESLQCSPTSSVAALAHEHSDDLDFLIAYIRQWANTIPYGCDISVSYPLMCDMIPLGARIAVVTVVNNRVRVIGELRFEVQQRASEDRLEFMNQGGAEVVGVNGDMEVQVRRQHVQGSSFTDGQLLPGEKTILREFSKQMREFRGETTQSKGLLGLLNALQRQVLGSRSDKDDRTFSAFFLGLDQSRPGEVIKTSQKRSQNNSERK
ncbi:hypothetical protein CYMTET_32763, partial [Cymbomonas tetramitiformis]